MNILFLWDLFEDSGSGGGGSVPSNAAYWSDDELARWDDNEIATWEE